MEAQISKPVGRGSICSSFETKQVQREDEVGGKRTLLRNHILPIRAIPADRGELLFTGNPCYVLMLCCCFFL